MKTHFYVQNSAAGYATVASLVTRSLLAQPEFGASVNLLPEGEFPGVHGVQPRGWNVPHPNYLTPRKMSIELLKPEADRPGNIVRFVNDSEPVTAVHMDTVLPIKPEWVGRTLIVELDMRSARLVPGTEG